MTDRNNKLNEAEISARLEKCIPEKIEFVNPVQDLNSPQVKRSLLAPDQLYDWLPGKRYQALAVPVRMPDFLDDIVPLPILIIILGGVIYWQTKNLLLASGISAVLLALILIYAVVKGYRLWKISRWPVALIRGQKLFLRKNSDQYFLQQPNGRKTLDLNEIDCFISVACPTVYINNRSWTFPSRTWHILYAVRFQSELECLMIAQGWLFSCSRLFYRTLARKTGKPLYEFQRWPEMDHSGKNGPDQMFLFPGS